MKNKSIIILDEDLIVKIVLLKLKKSNIIILEECNKNVAEEKRLYWDRIINYNKEEIEKEEQEFLRRIKSFKKRKHESDRRKTNNN